VETQPSVLPIRCQAKLPDGQRCGRQLMVWSLEFPVFQLDVSTLPAILAPKPMKSADAEGTSGGRYAATCPHCGADPILTAETLDRLAKEAISRGERTIWV
jgi:hypothetical protein